MFKEQSVDEFVDLNSIRKADDGFTYYWMKMTFAQSKIYSLTYYAANCNSFTYGIVQVIGRNARGDNTINESYDVRTLKFQTAPPGTSGYISVNFVCGLVAQK